MLRNYTAHSKEMFDINIYIQYYRHYGISVFCRTFRTQ